MSTLLFSEYFELSAASPSLSSHAFTVCPIEREQKGVNTQTEKPGIDRGFYRAWRMFPSPGERCPQNTPKRPPAGWGCRFPAAESGPPPCLCPSHAPPAPAPGLGTQWEPAVLADWTLKGDTAIHFRSQINPSVSFKTLHNVGRAQGSRSEASLCGAVRVVQPDL